MSVKATNLRRFYLPSQRGQGDVLVSDFLQHEGSQFGIPLEAVTHRFPQSPLKIGRS